MSDKEKKPKKVLQGDLPNSPVPLNELKSAKEHDLSHKRDEVCVPIAFEIVKLLAKMEYFPVGSHINEKETPVKSAYMPVVFGLMDILIKKNVKIVDITYIFSLVRQALEFVSDTIDETLNQNMNRVTELVYDLPMNDANEITVSQVNEIVVNKDKIREVWKQALDKKE